MEKAHTRWFRDDTNALVANTDAALNTSGAMLPQNVEAERALLGCICVDGARAVAEVVDLLEPDDFYLPLHRVIFATARQMWRQRCAIDLITLVDEMQRLHLLSEDDALAVTGLYSDAALVAHAREYARRVERCAVLRRLIAAAGEIAGMAYRAEHAESAIEAAHAILTDATIRHGGRDSITFSDALDDFLAEMDTALTSDRAPGVLTGFAELDKHLLGFLPGDLIYLCGRPGSGKSAYAAAIAAAVACDLRARGESSTVEWVSFEMTHTQQVKRLITSWAGVNGRTIRAGFRRADGSVDEDAVARVRETADLLRDAQGTTLRLWDQRMSLTQIKEHLTLAAYRRGLALGVVDYLGLLDPDSDQQRASEYEKITRFSRELKALALDLRIPILCLVQLNRDCEKRTNKRPQLADLRSSGGLEQDADMVLGVYRGAMYNAPQAKVDDRFRQFGEIGVLKARDGVRGVTIPTRFEAEYTRPSDWPEDWEYKTYLTINASEEWQGEGGVA